MPAHAVAGYLERQASDLEIRKQANVASIPIAS
jgi:hypothetical protein